MGPTTVATSPVEIESAASRRRKYDAFISYSHAADNRLAPELEKALRRLGRPWYKLWALRVFRDQTGLEATPRLWDSIKSGLSSSRYFIFLGSPEAASSPWVAREIHWWLDNHSGQQRIDQMLLAVTHGDLEWSNQAGDFDWAKTTALPSILRDRFEAEPLWVDLRWARTATDLSLRNTRFRSAALDLAAAIQGKPKDELDGEDVRQYQRTRRIAWAAVLSIVTLLFAFALAWLYAAAERRLATSRKLAAYATSQLSVNPELGVRFAREGLATWKSDEAAEALRETIAAWRMRSLPHSERVDMVLVDRDGHEALVVGGRHAQLWDLDARRRIGPPLTQPESFTAAALSPDGAWLATAVSGDYSIHLWRGSKDGWVDSGQQLPQSAAVNSLAFAPDGKFLLSGGVDGAILWQLDSSQPVRSFGAPGIVNQVAFDATGKKVLTAQNNWVRVWDAGTGRLLQTVEHESDVHSAAFSGDSTHVVSTNGNRVRLWEVGTGATQRVFDHEDTVMSAALSLDSDLLAVAHGNGVRVWSVTSGEWVTDLNGHASEVEQVTFAPNDRAILSASQDATAGVWALTPNLVQTVRQEKAAYAVAFSSDGMRLVSAGDDRQVHAWNATRGYLEWDQSRQADLHTLRIKLVTFDTSDQLILTLSDDNTARVWQARTGKPLGDAILLDPPVVAAGFARGDKVLVTIDGDGLHWWDLQTRQQISAKKYEVQLAAFSRRNARLVTVAKDELTVWDSDTGEPLGALLNVKTSVRAVAMSYAGDRAVVLGEDQAQVWDLDARKAVGPVIPTVGMTAVALSADLQLLATGATDGSVDVWDATSGIRLTTIKDHTGKIQALGFSPNGQFLASASSDTTVLIHSRIQFAPVTEFREIADQARPLTEVERTKLNDGLGWLGLVW
ncbi:MAG: TIR domain-containing protein [Deltaproteobacteria bacterium]|nr:TIR domain-containing protein [Deltaproteobacteria bacterium]